MGAVGEGVVLEEAQVVGVADGGDDAIVVGGIDTSSLPPLLDGGALRIRAAHQHHLAELVGMVAGNPDLVAPRLVGHSFLGVHRF